jgi:hypothetical protein
VTHGKICLTSYEISGFHGGEEDDVFVVLLDFGAVQISR